MRRGEEETENDYLTNKNFKYFHIQNYSKEIQEGKVLSPLLHVSMSPLLNFLFVLDNCVFRNNDNAFADVIAAVFAVLIFDSGLI